MRWLFIWLSILLSLASTAGGDPILKGTRFSGMGYSGICLADPWSLRLNPAGIAGVDVIMAGVLHQRHFLSNELSDQAIALVIPAGTGSFGIAADRSGGGLYNETRTSIAYAMRFGEGLRAGVQIDHFTIAIGDVYGTRNAWLAEVGMQARITDALWIGAHLFDPGSTRIGGPYDDRLPTMLRAGIQYIFSDRLLGNLEVEKDLDHVERYRIGIEYHPIDALFLRSGISTAPGMMHFGFGLRLDRLQLDVAVSTHAQLGATPMLGLNYAFK